MVNLWPLGVIFTGIVVLALSGCSGALGLLNNPGQISGTAAGLFGIPAATVSAQMTQEIIEIQAVAQQLQMLRAQLNGTPVVPPPLPALRQ